MEHRRAILQLWVDKITRHPVMGHCEVWKHFITCTADDKVRFCFAGCSLLSFAACWLVLLALEGGGGGFVWS